jgi:uncharacterized protein YkwD
MRPLLLVIAFALASCGGPSARFATTDASADEAAVASLISRHRQAHGLGPVSPNPRLTRMALAQARANAAIGELSHDAGGSFEARLASFGAGKVHAAENLGAGAASEAEAITRWTRSSEHNKNLLLPQAKAFGIARVDAPSTRYKRFWALILADG